MFWYPSIKDIALLSYGGMENMGVLTSDTAEGSEITKRARFYLDTDCWCLVFARAHFFGAPGSASMFLYVDSRLGRNHDTRLWEWAGCGPSGNDVNFRVVPEELVHWSFRRGDELVFTWTNPNPNNISWGLECGLADASNS